MPTSRKRTFATASAVGAAAFIVLYGWLYISGIFPLEVFVLFALVNLTVCLYSVKLATGAGR